MSGKAILAVCLFLVFGSILPAASQESLLHQDELIIRTPIGQFLLKNLRITVFRTSTGEIGSASFQGEVWNQTSKEWTSVSFAADLYDAAGLKITPNPYTIRLGLFPQGELKTFSVDIPSIAIQTTARYEVKFLTGDFPVKYTFTLVTPRASNDLSFEDQSIRIAFKISKQQIEFAMQNKTTAPIKLDWNHVSYIDPSGRAHRVIHAGVRYVDRDKLQAPTLIPPLARIEDLVYPASYVRWSSILNKWLEEPMLPDGFEALRLRGVELGVFMPLEISGKIVNYSFKFRIQRVE